jgi:hypothetical protein
MDNASQSAGQEPVAFTKEQVSALATDKEFRRLKPGSPEYAAAVEKKFPTRASAPSSASGGKAPEASTKTAAESQTPASGSPDPNETVEGLSPAAQKRLSQLAAREREHRTELENLRKWKAEREATETKQTPAPKSPSPNGPQFDKPKPERSDPKFKTVAEYEDARLDWTAEKREFERTQAADRKAFEEKIQTSFTKFRERGAEVEKELGLPAGDFESVMNDPNMKMFDSSRAALLESEHGARIAYDIGSDSESAKAFTKMNAAQQLKHIGKLEAKFESEAQAKQSKETTQKTNVSKAPAPSANLPRSTNPKATAGFEFKPGMSTKEYEAARRAARSALGKRA